MRQLHQESEEQEFEGTPISASGEGSALWWLESRTRVSKGNREDAKGMSQISFGMVFLCMAHIP